jgi:hypothetical protein
MEATTSIRTPAAVLEHPSVKQSGTVEVALCEAVHFRLLAPRPVFQLVEARLKLRDADLYRGWAEARFAAEERLAGRSLDDKIRTAEAARPEWEAVGPILRSTEMEVWMDLSYANPWIYDLYQLGLENGVQLHVPQTGPFPELFNKLLLQKNGFERLATEKPSGAVVRLGMDPVEPGQVDLILEPEVEAQREHALAEGDNLAARMANGAMIKDREERRARTPEASQRYIHDVGYRLIGPILTLLFQEMHHLEGSVSFCGKGSGFLTTFGQTLQQYWPWLPEIVAEDQGDTILSIFPVVKSDISLIPDPEKGGPSIIPLEELHPHHLLLAPLEAFIASALNGAKAAYIQSSASAFIRDYAQATRGLYLPLEVSDVMRQSRQQILSPRREFILTLLKARVLPEYRRVRLPWTTLRMVKSGPWPTASYLTACPISRRWVHVFAPQRARTIFRWLNRLGQPTV